MAETKHLHRVLVAGDATGEVDGFRLEAAVGRPFRAAISARFAGDVDPASLLGAPALLAFGRTEAEHAAGGVLTEVELVFAGEGPDGPFRRYELVLEARVNLLARSRGSRMFQDQDVRAIVTATLEGAGVTADEQRWELGGSYEKRAYCVQWQESAFAFVSRLCEAEGVYFFTEPSDEGEVLVLADDSTGAAELEGGPVRFRPPSGLEHDGDAFTWLRPRAELRPGKVTLRDYSFETPQIDLESTSSADTDTDLERYDYGRGFEKQALGDLLARVELESRRAERERLAVRGVCPRLRPGKLVEIEDAPLDLSGKYFVVSVVHAFGPGEGGLVLRTEAELLRADVPFRLPQTTPWPRALGPDTAIVVAPEGSESDEVHTDEHGRAKVRFFWDLAGVTDDKASAWLRVSQLQSSGSMMLPRIGWEVLVEYVHGDPDRPMITGRVYNGATMPPYALPAGKTRSTLQTASSPGSGGRNEIRMEDKAGSEEISVQAQKSHTLATAGDKITAVGNQLLQEIGGSRSVTVGGSQELKVATGLLDGIAGSQTVTIGGSRKVNVNAARTLKTGATVIAIGGGETAMIGNPLTGAIAAASAAAKEAAAAKANEAFEALDAKAAGLVDQVLGPVQGLASQAGAVGQAMQSVGAGNVGGLANAGAAASSLASSAPQPSSMLKSLAGGLLPDTAGQGGDGAGGGDGGGSSEANAAGPTAGVGATTDADNACGPGHAILDASSTHAETISGSGVVVAAGKITAHVTGAAQLDAGAARVDLVAGSRVETCDATKTETAVGLVVLAAGDEAETVGGARTTKVGGAIADKVSGSATVQAGGTIKMAGAYVRVQASGSITLKCGGATVTIAGGGIEFSGSAIAIGAPKIIEKSSSAQGS